MRQVYLERVLPPLAGKTEADRIPTIELRMREAVGRALERAAQETNAPVQLLSAATIRIDGNTVMVCVIEQLAQGFRPI